MICETVVGSTCLMFLRLVKSMTTSGMMIRMVLHVVEEVDVQANFQYRAVATNLSRGCCSGDMSRRCIHRRRSFCWW